MATALPLIALTITALLTWLLIWSVLEVLHEGLFSRATLTAIWVITVTMVWLTLLIGFAEASPLSTLTGHVAHRTP